MRGASATALSDDDVSDDDVSDDDSPGDGSFAKAEPVASQVGEERPLLRPRVTEADVRDTARDEALREEPATEEFFIGEAGVSRAHRGGDAGSVGKAAPEAWEGHEAWDVRNGWGSEDGLNAAPRISGLPWASLRGPSDSHLDLTPSPVPRVSLTPATAPVDVSSIPGPHPPRSRNLPTLAARHVRVSSASRADGDGGRFPRSAAPAMTFPPGTVSAPPPSRIARRLARDVRSSKREIVLGLSIGIGLSAVLCLIGESYLDDRRHVPVARGSAAPASGVGSAEAAHAGLVPGAYQDVETESQTSSALLPKNREPTPETSASSLATRATLGGSLLPPAAGLPAAAGLPPAALDLALVGARSASMASGVSKGEPRSLADGADRRSGSGLRQRSALARRPLASKGESGPESPYEVEATPADKAPLSPAESAGLGLDLPF